MLTLYNVTEAESGEYVCKVSNYIGEANQSAWLTVTRPLAKGNRKDAQWEASLDSPSPAVENKTLGSLVSAVFLVQKAMEKYPARPARFCALSSPPSVCFPPHGAATGAVPGVCRCPCPPSCLRPGAPHVLRLSRPALPELYFSMWPIASMFRWAGHSVW